MKALLGTFNQEKAPGGAFSVIVKTDFETDGSFYSTINNGQPWCVTSLPSPVDSGCVYLDILNGYKSFPDRVQNQNFTESSNLVRAQPSALA